MAFEENRIASTIICVTFLLSIGVLSPVRGQQCDDFESCTTNDMCSGGACSGSPSSGGACDDFNPCTTNDSCASGTCTGAMAPTGTPCGSCGGTCQFGFCLPDFLESGPCDDGIPCTTNDVCQFGVCFGTLRTCPDSDGNPCTADFCNPTTGQCQSTNFPPCAPCQTCRRTEGGFACDLAPNGTTCDDFEQCTGSSSCVGGDCVASTGGSTPTPGVPTPTTGVPTPTTGVPTPTTGVPTATVTQVVPTPSPTGGAVACVGDCDLNGQVTVDEIVTAVNIALGTRNVADCLAADSNLDSQVTVDEIVTAVNNALTGC